MKTPGTVGRTKNFGGQHFQRLFDVGKVRTLILCTRCIGWSSDNWLDKRLRSVRKQETRGCLVSSEGWSTAIGWRVKEKRLVHGRRVPITESEFQSRCELHDPGTCMAQCGSAGGNSKQALHRNSRLLETRDALEERGLFDKLRRPVYECRGA